MNRRDDTGASLIIALVVITVFSVIVAALMTFADTSLRNTIALRGQAADTATAEGAAQIAINALRRGSFDGTGDCFGGTTNTLALPAFYAPPTGPASSAVVTCAPDAGRSNAGSPVAIDHRNKPRNAILTMSTIAGEDGLNVDVADGRSLRVHGSVFSNSTVVVPRGTLDSSATVTARGACSGTVAAAAPPTCGIGSAANSAGDDPLYPAPTAATTTQSVPVCTTNNQLVTFTPGLYTDITSLNNMTRCHNSIFYFPPGTYYFSFSSASPWLIDQGYLVAGTPTSPLVAGTPPAIPGSCRSPMPPVPADPTWTPPGANAGVQFVFGGGARILLRRSQAEICGNYSATSPPIAIYGLSGSVGPVPAQSGCTIVGPYPTSGCAVIKAEASTASRFHVQGTTYLPNSAIDLALSNPPGLIFSVGVIARTLRLAPSATADLAGPVIEVPDDAEVGRRTLVVLTVTVCPGASTCTVADGRRRLRVTVGLLDPTGTAVPGARQVTVYSWSVLR